MTQKVERSRLELICWSVALLVSAVAPAPAQQLVPAPLPVSDSIRVPALFPADGRLATRVATPKAPNRPDTTAADSARRQACHDEIVHNSRWGAVAGLAWGFLPALLTESFAKSKWSGPLVLVSSAAFTATVAGVATTMRSPCS